jgi:DNA-binding NarL/FixJ family response regulator
MYEPGSANASVVLIDNESLYCTGLCLEAARAEHHLEVLAVASTIDDGLEAVERLAPAVVLLNAALAGNEGLVAVRDIRRKNSSTNVILTCTRKEDETLYWAIKYGAAAYVVRTIDGADLCKIIRQVASGAYLIDEDVLAGPVVAARILQSFRDMTDVAQHAAAPLFAPLSTREIGVLASISQGRSNKEVATALHISDQTVKNHITSIMRKLAVNDRTRAVVVALQHGWIKG